MSGDHVNVPEADFHSLIVFTLSIWKKVILLTVNDVRGDTYDIGFERGWG